MINNHGDSNTKNNKLKLTMDILSILQSFFTIVAVMAAGWWFFFQAETSPRVGISHSITHRKINNDWVWAYASITIANLGKRPINFNSEKVWLQKVMPVDKSIKDKIEKNISLINEERHIKWPLIGEPYQRKIDIDIYPGEEDTLNYEFIIPSYIKTVRLYSFYQRQGSSRGWQLATLYEIKN